MVAFGQVPYLVPTQTKSKQTLTDLSSCCYKHNNFVYQTASAKELLTIKSHNQD